MALSLDFGARGERAGWSPNLADARLQLAVLAAAALLLRAPLFGDPVIHVDEQYYLLVGARMLHGALPYVDLWDRKPIGLFLLYETICRLGGDGILQYQIVATLFAIATAWVLAQIACRAASPPAAIGAGIAYLIYLNVSDGQGGQTPVFYNLLVALAAWLALREVERPGFDRRTVAIGAAAMALVGCAMQIKYSVLFEGCYFALALLWKAHREPRRALAAALLWMGIAIAPTAAAYTWYAAAGYGADFLFANFTSIGLRGHETTRILAGRLLDLVGRCWPLIAAVIVARIARDGEGRPLVPRDAGGEFVFGWALAASFGVLVFGTYFDHYALPLYAPFAVQAAPVLDAAFAQRIVMPRLRRTARILAWAVPLFGIALAAREMHYDLRKRGDGSQVRAIAAYIRPRLHGCLFVFDGEPILYQLTGACIPTRWAFPDHFTNPREVRATGMDQLGEALRVLARRPQFIVTTFPPSNAKSTAAWPLFWDHLRQSPYRPVLAIKLNHRARMLFELDPAYRGGGMLPPAKEALDGTR